MLWLKAHHNCRSLLIKAAALGLVGMMGLSSAGCGFRPLYGPTESGASLVDTMKTVQITPIPSRVGQKLRNELIFGVTGGGEASAPIYRLDIALKESASNTLVQITGTPTGQIYELDAEFRLIRLKDNQVLLKGASSSTAAYDLNGATGQAGSVYGDVRAKIDAQDRAARMLSDTLKTRVASFLARST